MVVAIDLTDFDVGYKCDGTSALIDEASNVNMPEVGTMAEVTGIVGSDLKARGFSTPIGAPGADAFFDVAFSAGNAFDIRGVTSISAAMWVFINPAHTAAQPWLFANHSVADPDGQSIAGFAIDTLHGPGGGVGAPSVSMYDGLVNNSVINVNVSPNLGLSKGAWHFVAYGWDSVRNKLWIYWGRDAKSNFYNEKDGFAAGFGYVGAPQTASLLKFQDNFGGNTSSLIDHFMWWNGRSLTKTELDFLHNRHLGRNFNDLTGTSGLAVFDFSDYDAGYDCEEASGALIEVDGNSNLDFPITGAIGSVSGKLGSGRGPTLALGSPGPDYWTRPYLSDPVFDIRGLHSFSVLAWVKLLDLTGQHNIFTIHSASDEEGQAILMIARETNGSSSGAPQLHLLDGITPFVGPAFNVLGDYIAGTNNQFPKQVTGNYTFIAASFDVVANVMRIFWGRRPGEYHFFSGAGLAAGFGYDGSASTGSPGFGGVNVAKFTGGGVPASFDIDQIMWWKDRALDEDEMVTLWNDHAALDFGAPLIGAAAAGSDDEQFSTIQQLLLAGRRR